VADVLEIFASAKPVIGMLHVPALPGSPRSTATLDAIRDFVLRDAEALAAGGVDGLMLENFGDTPFYPARVPPHTIAFLTRLGAEVKAACALPLGINVLRNDGLAAVAVAVATGAAFVRINVYTGARLTDQGIVQGEAHEVQRYRKLLGSDVRIMADVAVKHSSALAPRGLADEVEDTIARGHADAVIVSGAGTGKATSIDEVRIAKQGAGAALVFVGSGADAESALALLAHADGLIAGTALKRDGVTTAPVDAERVRRFMATVRR
jgi:uncharacterized protein